jgi:hypothetical protein
MRLSTEALVIGVVVRRLWMGASPYGWEVTWPIRRQAYTSPQTASEACMRHSARGRPTHTPPAASRAAELPAAPRQSHRPAVPTSPVATTG